jgi:hypothetical protein
LVADDKPMTKSKGGVRYRRRATSAGGVKVIASATRGAEADNQEASVPSLLGSLVLQFATLRLAQEASRVVVSCMAPNVVGSAARAAWSAVHGLASLLLDGPLPTTDADIEFSLGRVLDLIARGLLSSGAE